MERIHVTVRARPLMPDEAKASQWRITGNSIFITNHSSKFEFDRIFEQDCRTLEVYHARTRDIVAAAVRGFNGTVFAYGQTNSGKTHTMRGSPTEPGVIPLAVNDLFDIIQGEGEREFLLRMSYMEIYNEDVNDLLVPEHRKLQIHENLERGIYVAGLREEIVASPQQVLNLMDFGESHRHIGETNMNLHSSRSHTIFRMIIESRDKTEDGNNDNSCDAVRVSVLNLVDLAGSERAAKTGAEGVRLKEGSHINKSLMTLGTVIKKLSEGAESQGGHVPYRDSKLTRILQPALGGNANTAIICNITLAQIHTDETKSSLQFASRALRVTNCARVNEILTDAALLKRQKKEIEELRAKLQANHSEHLEEEILGLRNTLLQSELERECIALELEEEKKAQAEREKMLQEQAKKIQNLSSMVLYSSRDEIHQHIKKSKRRDTWCPGNLSRESLQVVCSNVHSKASAVKSARPDRDIGPLLPFEELVNESAVADESCKQDEDGRDHSLEIDNLPDPCALLNITSRRKMPLKKKSSSVGYNELEELQAEYEDLFLKFESQRTTSEIQINILTRKLAEANLSDSLKTDVPSTYNVNESTFYGDKRTSVRESEAKLVIQQLQEKIKMLEVQKSSNRQSLDNLVELAVEQDICAREKLEEFQEELLNAREEARVAQEQLASSEFTGRIDLSEVEEVVNELQRTKRVVDNALSLVDDFFMMQSAIHTELLDFKASVRHISEQHYSVIQNRQKLQCCMRVRVSEVENEKLLMDNKSVDLQRQLKEIREFSEQQHLEKLELFTHIQTMENELSSLSSSSLVREKESLRKDLEKTKTKLKETECKLKNAIQEKTKLEGEKAVAEREVKRLHGQNTLLERDRRRDSVAEKTSRVVDPKMGKGPGVSFEHMQEDYQKLEVLAFEMETAIASLEEELATASMEKEEALARNENLASELEAVSERFSKSSTELNELHEEISGLRSVLGESKVKMEKMEGSIKILLEEKEELAMQLTDSLLAMEEEKAIWSAKEKASVEAIEEKVKLYNAEIALLSKEMSEERDNLMTQIEEQQRHVVEVEHLRKNCNDALLEAKAQVEELTKIISNIKAKVHTDEVNNNKEKAKLRMRLRGTQAQLDAFRFRYNQALNDSDTMDKKFAEASANLKDRLASKGLEVLTLKKQLAAAMKQ